MNTLITATFNEIQVSFTNEAFLNATAIAKSFNKQPKDYLKTEQTKAYIKALAQNLSKRTKILLEENQLVRVKHGGNNRGTWLHPKLAVHFARWLSPEFAVWCDEQIEKILNHKDATSQHRKVFVSACTKLSVGNKSISKVYTDVANHFGYEKPVDMPIDILPEAIAYVYEELLAQEKARTSPNESNNQSLKHLVTSCFYVYEWYKQIEPAIDIINPNAVGSIREHIDRCKVYANTLNRNNQIGMSDDVVKHQNFGFN